MIDAGLVNEGENILSESIVYTQKEDVLVPILFYQYIGERDSDFLAAHHYSKEGVLDGMKRLAERQGYGHITSLLMENWQCFIWKNRIWYSEPAVAWFFVHATAFPYLRFILQNPAFLLRQFLIPDL